MEQPKKRRKLLNAIMGAAALVSVGATETGRTEKENTVIADKAAEVSRNDAEEKLGKEMYETGQKVLKEKYLAHPKIQELWKTYQSEFDIELRLAKDRKPGSTPKTIFDLEKKFTADVAPYAAEVDRSGREEKGHMREYLRVYAKFMLAHQNEKTWAFSIKNNTCRRCEDGSIDIVDVPKYNFYGSTVVNVYLSEARSKGSRTADDILKDIISGVFDESVLKRLSVNLRFDHAHFNDIVRTRDAVPSLVLRPQLEPLPVPPPEVIKKGPGPTKVTPAPTKKPKKS